VSLEFASLPVAFVAGVLGIVSPCVWPLVPVVLASAATGGRQGPFYLALGLSTAFAVAGTVLTWMLFNLGLNPDAYRVFAAVLLVAVAAALLVDRLGAWLALHLSRLTAGVQLTGSGSGGAVTQFGVGALLGLVWLPCVGPTLGAAIALASLGQAMGMAFLVMFSFGVGTAAALLAAGFATAGILNRARPGLLAAARRGKRILGWLLLALAMLVLSGLDKALEAWALGWLPQWSTGF
jgi:cytochrome c-type biogenesis protein